MCVYEAGIFTAEAKHGQLFLKKLACSPLQGLQFRCRTLPRLSGETTICLEPWRSLKSAADFSFSASESHFLLIYSGGRVAVLLAVLG